MGTHVSRSFNSRAAGQRLHSWASPHELWLLLLAVWAIHLPAVRGQDVPATPPVAPVRPVITDYYGTEVVDPYRYVSEFGSAKTKAGLEALYAMSPYAHVKDGTPYPAVLLTAGMNDPLVAPWQMDKMAARLQAVTSSGKPVLLRMDYAGGHAVTGATKAQMENLVADMFSFLFWQLGAPGFQPAK